MKHAKIYLAGGLYTDWQDRVLQAFLALGLSDMPSRRTSFSDPIPDHVSFEFYDPRCLAELPLNQVAAIEELWLRQATHVFAYFESSNPTGYGLCFEMGMGRARQIPIVFVDEKWPKTDWIGQFATIRTQNINEGLDALRELLCAF